MAEPLPDEIIVRSRDESRDAGLGGYLAKRPNDNVNPGSFPHTLMSAIADMCVAQGQNARVIGRSIPLSEVTGIRLDQRLAEEGLPARFAERGSSGFIIISTSGGGATLTTGNQLTEDNSQSIFEFTGATGTYNTGDAVPIQAITTGPGTNFEAGATLTWSDSIAGLSPGATVQEPGLSGGRLAESDEQVRGRISDAKADPAAAGNSALYIRLAENSGQHGVAVQKAFWYPACNGPGTGGLAILLTPGGPGTSRIATAPQMALVRAYVETVPDDPTRVPPEDDQMLDVTVDSQPVSIVADIRWSAAGAGWKDAVQWPIRHAEDDGAVVISAAVDATHFTIAKDDADYTDEPQPQTGQTIALYNLAVGTFARKRILSFTGTGPWVITVDTTNDSSDTTYVPVVGQRVSPWSESLDDIATPILDYFDALGPGEMFAPEDMFDPGFRLKRTPSSPEAWPNEITSHLESDILDVDAVGNAVVQEGMGTTTDVGTPGALVFLLTLADVAAFPL